MFGVYIHIPYCLQRCSYCDFATYVYDQILPPKEYIELLCLEMKNRQSLAPDRPLTSVYFGGGTPSLLNAKDILYLIESLEKNNFVISKNTEITLEINPATLDESKIKELISGGVNRFSVGAQSFNDQHLKAAGRKHNADDTRQTLDLLKSLGVNYSFDLLFALPNQSMEELKTDLEMIKAYHPPHLSAYCLTVPTGHPMSFNRPADEDQTKMFEIIIDELNTLGLRRYEISNFSKPGFESKHNLLYWQDQPYLSFGLSAHSYIKHKSQWGQRFWNPSSIDEYKKCILSPKDREPLSDLKNRKCLEELSAEQSLFDFCHTALRLDEGLHKNKLIEKYETDLLAPVFDKLKQLEKKNLLEYKKDSWKLSSQGVFLSNQVFSELY